MTKWTRLAVDLFWPLVFSFVLIFVSWGVAEALAGGDFFSVARDLGASRPAAERVHTRYDADVGWINLPNVSIPDLYGPKLSFHTNSRGFRNSRDFTNERSAGKHRFICSGDSFTLGYGVADDQTWVSRLETLDPSLETVNMGQGGYGIDQSYLWFIRDGETMDYDVHVQAFIYTDFERMRSGNFLGYHKPRLIFGPDGLVAEKALPPTTVSHMPWLTQKLVVLHRLRTVRALEVFFRKYILSIDDAKTRTLSTRIFTDLNARAQKRGAHFAAVYLPTEMDLEPTHLDDLRAFLKEELARRNVVFIDLTGDFRQLAAAQRQRFFLTGADSPFVGADGHYSEEGNAWVAQTLLKKLNETDFFNN